MKTLTEKEKDALLIDLNKRAKEGVVWMRKEDLKKLIDKTITNRINPTNG